MHIHRLSYSVNRIIFIFYLQHINTTEKMKAAIYLRTSTEEQEPEKQRQACLEFAKQRGYEVTNVYLEQISGFKDVARPEYEKIKQQAFTGEIKAVIVWALDRWVRNRDTLLHDVSILRNYGCKIHSVQEQWLEAINLDGPLGKTIQDFLLGLIGSMGELESQRKSERVKMAFKSHKGKKWGRPSVHTNKKKIVWGLRSEGKSMRDIAKQTKLSLGKVSEICSEKHPLNPC